MKHGRYCLFPRIFILMVMTFYGFVGAEVSVISGDYTGAPGDPDLYGDLIILDGDVNVLGDLFIDGDLKLGGGKVTVTAGNLKVGGDLIVTNTNETNPDATIIIRADDVGSAGGNLDVAGAIITNSKHGEAKIDINQANGIGGNIRAGRIITNGYGEASVIADSIVTVTGSVITKSQTDDASLISWGSEPVDGGIYAGSVYLYSPEDHAVVQANDGHVIVNGPMVTNAYLNGNVYVEYGNVEAASISTRSETGEAYISAEKVSVIGDIRTYALEKNAYVLARETSLGGQEGTFEDVYAQNIYTRGPWDVSVYARRSILVRGDIVSWQTESSGRSIRSRAPSMPWDEYEFSGVATSAGYGTVPPWLSEEMESPRVDRYKGLMRLPSYSEGVLHAQNVILVAVTDDAALSAGSRVDVSGDIIIKSGAQGGVYSDGDIVSGNIYVNGSTLARVYSEGDLLVDHVISTSSVDPMVGRATGGDALVYAAGTMEAEKIFTEGVGDSSVYSANDTITVNGPIVSKSLGGDAYVFGDSGITAGSISTDAWNDGFVNSVNGPIIVREDIRTRSVNGDSFVEAELDDLSARSIKTNSPSGQNDSIRSAAGSGLFQLILNADDADSSLVIKDSEFGLDSDRVWNATLSLIGTCTLDGKGHDLYFDDNGGIEVRSGATLMLKNVNLRNFAGTAVRCADNTSTISFQDVTLSLSADATFRDGIMHLVGDLKVSGTGGTIFGYESGVTSTIGRNATLFFDRGMTFSYDSAIDNGVDMIDETSRLHFSDGILNAKQNIRLIRGTLVMDNIVTLSATNPSTGKITLGNGTAADNLHLDFGRMADLRLGGPVENENA